MTGARDPIAVFRLGNVIEGTIPRLEARMTESLGAADRIRIRTDPLEGEIADRLVIELDEVVAVAAPPRPPSPFRVSRRQHAVEIKAGPYRVRGVAHLPPGADPERYVASASRRWLPLTDCTVRTDGDTWAVDVVIVNMDFASREKEPYLAPRFG